MSLILTQSMPIYGIFIFQKLTVVPNFESTLTSILLSYFIPLSNFTFFYDKGWHKQEPSLFKFSFFDELFIGYSDNPFLLQIRIIYKNRILAGLMPVFIIFTYQNLSVIMNLSCRFSVYIFQIVPTVGRPR